MKTIHKQAGATLLEMVIAIVIISIALTGILSTINALNRASVDPVLQLQAIIYSESFFEELDSFDSRAGGLRTWEQLQQMAPRSPVIKAMQERGFSMEISVLPNQSIFAGVAPEKVRRIVVTCRHPAFDVDAPIVLTGYRIDIDAPRSAGGLEVPFNAL